MGSLKFIELETGSDSWLKKLYFFIVLLAVLAILTAATTWLIKFATLGALILFLYFSSWQVHHQTAIRQLRIYNNGTVTLTSGSGQEFLGILESDSWTTKWVSIVPVGRFDRWRVQRCLVCSSRNNASDYRQLMKKLRLGAGNPAGDGILGPG